jgi:spermidine synthase
MAKQRPKGPSVVRPPVAEARPVDVAWRGSTLVPALLLLLSGISALIFQILWVKQVSLIVGVDVHAVTVAVSAFFAGLAIGSYLFGRMADRVKRPLALYGLIELGVGLLGVGSTVALAHAAPLFANAEKTVGVLAWVLPFALVGLPASLMGGTLPVLVRALAGRAGSGPISSAGGRLYAANTAGAVAGALFTSFLLIPSLGVIDSSIAAAAINAVAALGAMAFGRGSALGAVHGAEGEATNNFPESRPSLREGTLLRGAKGDKDSRPALEAFSAPRLPAARLALALYAFAGGVALGYEVVWSQVIVQWTGTRTFAFAVVLANYLTGLVIGSAWYARRSEGDSDPWGHFGLLVAAAGVVALLEVLLLGDWLSPLQVTAATQVFNMTGSEPAAMMARFAVAAACVVLIPTVLLGAAFPAALRLTGSAPRAGQDSGGLIACNTLGGIAGTLLTGFVLVPWLGLERSLAALAVAAAIIGAIAVSRGTSVRRFTRWATLACGVVAVVTAVTAAPDHLARLFASGRKGDLVFHETGAGGDVSVLEQGPRGHRFRRLYIQGVSNSGDSMTSLRYMRLQALLPLIVHRGEPRSAFVIGLGTGVTAGSLLCDEGLSRRVCAELLPQVVRAAPLFQGNIGIATDERVDIRLRDGRRELLRSDESYDVITLEPPPPSAAGVVNLYSRDFYALAATRLQPDGLLAQWLPLPTQTESDTRSLLRSFLDVFPYATLWTSELHETLLVGSLSPMELNAGGITARFNQPRIAEALREVGIASPAALLATFVTDRAGLERYAGDAPTVSDDRPRIEYGPWVLPGEFERTLPHVLNLQIEPPLAGADAALRSAVTAEREILHRFYASALYAYTGDRAQWQQAHLWVLSKDPTNPYYRWFGRAGDGAPTSSP